MAARPAASVLVGYGGVVAREQVRAACDLFITHFDELTAIAVERRQLREQSGGDCTPE